MCVGFLYVEINKEIELVKVKKVGFIFFSKKKKINSVTAKLGESCLQRNLLGTV